MAPKKGKVFRVKTLKDYDAAVKHSDKKLVSGAEPSGRAPNPKT